MGLGRNGEGCIANRGVHAQDLHAWHSWCLSTVWPWRPPRNNRGIAKQEKPQRDKEDTGLGLVSHSAGPELNPLWELLDKKPLPQPWGITGGFLTGFQQWLGTAWAWHSKAGMQSGGISPVCHWLRL